MLYRTELDIIWFQDRMMDVVFIWGVLTPSSSVTDLSSRVPR